MMGQRVRKLRQEHGMSQTELAKKVGVGQAHISDIELNHNAPSMDVLVRLAEALGVTVDDLLNEERR